MHSIWSGALVFGLVNIPVKIYSAADETAIHFTMLHKKDHSPVRYAKMCKLENKEISYQDIVKGFQYEKGRFVPLSETDFEKANVKASHAIEIVEFTNESEVDIRYFEKPYYLEPDTHAGKAYALLRDALIKSKKIAIAKFVMHGRPHLGVLKAVDQLLLLEKIRFHSEIRLPDDLKLPETPVSKKELDMALALINQLTRHFKSGEFHDTYAEDLQKIIQAKLKGKKMKSTGKIPKKTTSANLMKTLMASLEKPKRSRKGKKAA